MSLLTPKRYRHAGGWSLVEILIALAIFSVATVGLYVAMEGMNDTMMEAMDRNLEAAYVNMLVGEVNPDHPGIETVYNVKTPKPLELPAYYGDLPPLERQPSPDELERFEEGPAINLEALATKETASPPKADQRVYYSRLVDSCPNPHCPDATPDVKNISIFLYRSANAKEPYRTFRREIAPNHIGLNLGEPGRYYKDVLGNVWAPAITRYDGRTGKRQNGPIMGFDGRPYQTVETVGGTNDSFLFQSGVEREHLRFGFNASIGHPYTVELGFAEVEPGIRPGARPIEVWVNGKRLDTVDVMAEAGQEKTAMVKQYKADALPHPSFRNVGLVVVELIQAKGARAKPRVSFISLKR